MADADDNIAISIQDLRRTYTQGGQQVPAVRGVSIDVRAGEWYTLLGPSGCGKTTTLRCIAGLERPEGGRIALEGVTVVSGRTFVPAHKRGLGMVFQDYAVWPHMTVAENIEFPLVVTKGKRPGRAEIKQRVEEVLELVGMPELANRPASRLSGGQQQRLSLARALVGRPRVLLLDEPLSNLDARLRDEMRTELRKIQRRLGVTTVFVTHDQVEALAMSNRIAVLRAGQVVQEGGPHQIYMEPADQFVAGFVGATNFVDGTVTAVLDENLYRVSTRIGDLRARTTTERTVGEQVVVSIRPEAITVLHAEDRQPDATHNVVAGKVSMAMFTGALTEYGLEVEGRELRAVSTARMRHRRGEGVTLEIPVDECVLISLGGREELAAATGVAVVE